MDHSAPRLTSTTYTGRSRYCTAPLGIPDVLLLGDIPKLLDPRLHMGEGTLSIPSVGCASAPMWRVRTVGLSGPPT